MSEKGRVLVISAHPDDEVLGCGGTIARLTQHGYPVCIAILGEGVTSRYGAREEAPVEETTRIREQASRSATLLGAGDLRMFQLPDNRFDTVPPISSKGSRTLSGISGRMSSTPIIPETSMQIIRSPSGQSSRQCAPSLTVLCGPSILLKSLLRRNGPFNSSHPR
jgi:hypothetical protein